MYLKSNLSLFQRGKRLDITEKLMNPITISLLLETVSCEEIQILLSLQQLFATIRLFLIALGSAGQHVTSPFQRGGWGWGARGTAMGRIKGKLDVACGVWATAHAPMGAARVLSLPKEITVATGKRRRADASMEGGAGRSSELGL